MYKAGVNVGWWGNQTPNPTQPTVQPTKPTQLSCVKPNSLKNKNNKNRKVAPEPQINATNGNKPRGAYAQRYNNPHAMSCPVQKVLSPTCLKPKCKPPLSQQTNHPRLHHTKLYVRAGIKVCGGGTGRTGKEQKGQWVVVVGGKGTTSKRNKKGVQARRKRIQATRGKCR